VLLLLLLLLLLRSPALSRRRQPASPGRRCSPYPYPHQPSKRRDLEVASLLNNVPQVPGALDINSRK